MPRPRRPLRRGRPIFTLILLSALLIGLFSWRGGDARLYPPHAASPTTTIFLVDNGFHSDIALPRAALAGDPILGRAAGETTSDPWVMVGWGDARFYEDSGINAQRVLEGLGALWPHQTTIVHLEGLANQPDMAFDVANTRPIRISQAGLSRLLARMDRSLSRDGAGAPIRAAAPAGQDAAFFQSGETFSLLHLCNHWTGEALNAAGLPVDLALDTAPAGLRLDLAIEDDVRDASAPGTARRSASPRGRSTSTG